MTPTQLSADTLRAFRDGLDGDGVLPGDADYDEARTVYNTVHTHWPALVVRAASTDDVVRAVRLAAGEGLMLAVRGGNHSMRGYGSCDDGVVLDLSRLRSVQVDPVAGTARVAGGATWADVNQATHAHGLATTGGLVSTTGVGGLTLGGGFGYLTRRLGMACDNLVEAEVVTAQGEVLTVDAAREPDLFWAIRGGGGNFGVVTSFTFRLAPVDGVLAGPLVFELTPEVVERYVTLMRGAPRELGAVLGLTLAPPLPFLPEERHGRPCAVVVACWSGEAEAGQDVLQRLKGLGAVLGHAVSEMPYPAINTSFDGLLPAGLRHYWKSHFASRFPDRACASYAEHGRRTPTPESGIFLYPVDGAVHDVAVEDTAWPHRDARFLVGFHGSWRDPARDAPITAWVRTAHAACAPWGSGGAYVNFVSDDEDVSTNERYGPSGERLLRVKRRYDPHNLFCLNANVDPERT